MKTALSYCYFTLLIYSFCSLCRGENECSVDEPKSYISCVESKKNENEKPWSTFKMPYANRDEVNSCFSDAGCDEPDFDRSLFVDFVKLWQNSVSKLWNDYVSTPEVIKECMRNIVAKYVQIRFDQCFTSGSLLPLGYYPEDVELPYCLQKMPNPEDVTLMETGLKTKVNVLQALSNCKEKNETASTVATECLTNLRRNKFVKNFCPLSSECLKSNVSDACSADVRKAKLAICQCARSYRDNEIAKIDAQYASGSVNLLALSPAFLGMDVTPEISTQMKQCYKTHGKKPISMLNILENRLLTGPLLSVKPRPQGIQAIRRLVFSQLDLPDFCEECSSS